VPQAGQSAAGQLSRIEPVHARHRSSGQCHAGRAGDLPYYIKAPQTDTRITPDHPTPVYAPYDEEALMKDFWALWNTGFLDNIWIETIDEPFENGVRPSTSSITLKNERA
jgi:hypothetical protein